MQLKILAGYVIVFAVIGCMSVILLRERHRIKEIEAGSDGLVAIRRGMQQVHRSIAELAMYGESVISWDSLDYKEYTSLRLHTDSLLAALGRYGDCLILPGQLDTLRCLLSDKEKYLQHIVETLQEQETADNLLVHRLPVLTRQATCPKAVVRKKKGIAGWLGGKKTVHVFASPGPLYALNSQLIGMQRNRARSLGTLTDSLRQKNRILNSQLMGVINRLDKQSETILLHKEEQVEEMEEESFYLLSGVIAAAIMSLFVFFLIIRRDIRRREGLIRKNREMLEMRKKIILTLSHDIRGPLNAISGNAELSMDTRDRKKRNAHLNNIRILCRHILHLLNNLLDVYRLNEAKEIRNDVPFHLSELLERIASIHSQPVNDKGLLFAHEFSGADVVVSGDTDRIEQIVDNLLVNAVKFTDTGTIRFTATYKGGMLLLEISDTGIGMGGEQLDRIFNPFERGNDAAHAEGFGLGLAITRGLVSLLDGTISVTSRKGQGSTFLVSLPLPETAEAGEEEPATPNCPLRPPGRVILIDDDPMQLEIVKEMLERSGISCRACGNVQEVVREMRTTDFDLLLTDIQMAGTNGFDLLKLLRGSTIGNSRTIPVVAMTARGDKEKGSFLQVGFTACIYKPFSMNELLVLLSSTMQTFEEKTMMADFSALTTDVRDKRKMLETFVRESANNIAELEQAMEAGNVGKMREIIHRMLPVLEMVKAEEPLFDYRALLHTGKNRNILWEQTAKVVSHLRMLADEAVAEIQRIDDERENTDSGR
ncbi:signal transduction histidine kinase/DNA-binding response OmpR family regulator [Bacteroides reticulotermitis]|uniref:histidine kinase n=1 Tax=Bacteroides reticulotermitis TaxID=1133319 RepID=A0A840DBL4_9BACE|nr:signal transduction histidine kinase/DNA-binding response OmpR family regulator [Bacteroides reticulotermitis]